MARKKRNRLIKRIINGILLLLFLCVVLLVTAYLMVTYRPGEYGPRPISIQEQKEAEARMWKKSEKYANHMGDFSISDTFTLEFDQTLLNHMLLHDDTNYFLNETLGRSSDVFASPQIAFAPGTFKIMGRVYYEGITSLLTIELRPRIDSQGRLEIALSGARLGALGIPGSAQDRFLERVIEKLADRIDSQRGDEVSRTLRDILPALRELQETGRCYLSATFKAAEADNRRGRIESIEITKEKLAIVIKPESMKG